MLSETRRDHADDDAIADTCADADSLVSPDADETSDVADDAGADDGGG